LNGLDTYDSFFITALSHSLQLGRSGTISKQPSSSCLENTRYINCGNPVCARTSVCRLSLSHNGPLLGTLKLPQKG